MKHAIETLLGRLLYRVFSLALYVGTAVLMTVAAAGSVHAQGTAPVGERTVAAITAGEWLGTTPLYAVSLVFVIGVVVAGDVVRRALTTRYDPHTLDDIDDIES